MSALELEKHSRHGSWMNRARAFMCNESLAFGKNFDQPLDTVFPLDEAERSVHPAQADMVSAEYRNDFVYFFVGNTTRRLNQNLCRDHKMPS